MTSIKATSGKEYIIKDEDNINNLGQGSFGTVYKCHTQIGEVFALKKIPLNSAVGEEKIKYEIKTMLDNGNKQFNNLIYAVDYAQDSKFYYVIMPFCDQGSLTSLINKGLLKDEQQIIEYF